MSATTREPRVTKRQIKEAARILRSAIAAAYCRTDEYDHPIAAERERREHRAALRLLIQLATKALEAQP